MSKPIDDGGPAFPRPCGETDHYECGGQVGASLRDYFAGEVLGDVIKAFVIKDDAEHHQLAARIAYNLADAMIAERKKGTSS